jgi:hypothetical protein
VVGPKQLQNIRRELQRALGSTGDDPIRWLEKRMRASAASGGNEMLRSLQRFIEGRDGRETERNGLARSSDVHTCGGGCS